MQNPTLTDQLTVQHRIQQLNRPEEVLMNSPVLICETVPEGVRTVSTSPVCILDANIERRVRAMAASDNAALWDAQTELSAAVAKAGMHFEGRPYPVSLRPLAITEQQSKGIADVAEQIVAILDWAAELYCRDASVQQLFPAYGNLMKWTCALPVSRPIVRICRLDGLIASDGKYKVIETNTEGPGGVIQNGLAGNVWADMPNPLTKGLPIDVRKQPFVKDPECFVQELIAAHAQAAGRPLRRAAIVNFRGRFTNEVDWMVRGLQRQGIEAALVDAGSIRRSSKGVVGPDGEIIDLAYNKLDVRDMIDAPEAADYLTACAAGEITSVNPWISQWVLSDKAILAVLSDNRFSMNFTSKQRDVIRQHVPWTRYISNGMTTDAEGQRVDLISYVERNRTALVLKPSNATRGEHVLVGRFTSPEEWRRHLGRAAQMPYVVQAYVEPGTLTAPHPVNRSVDQMAYGIDAYVFGGRFAGFQARASLDPVMNVGKRGALLPVAIAKKGI